MPAREQVADILKEYAKFNTEIQERLRAALGYERGKFSGIDVADSTKQRESQCQTDWKDQSRIFSPTDVIKEL